MQEEIRWVASTAELAEELAALGPGPLSIDSEADSLHHYPEKVCLVQLSFRGRDLLLDPLGGVDPGVLQQVTGEAGTRKILHGADYDLRVLHRDFGLTIRGLFDTMIAARLVGERAFGLGALLRKFLSVELDKRFQRADWSQRPLPMEMQRYAVMDTRYLEELAGILLERLEELGREGWAAEEFARLEAVRWSQNEKDPDAFQRVKKSGSLPPRELGVLRELYELRERVARHRDRPPFRIVRDSTRPQSDPCEARGLPRWWLRAAATTELRQAIERGLDLPDDELPSRKARRRPARRPAFEKRLREVCRRRDRLADDLDLESSVLAPRAALERALDLLEEQGSLDGAHGLRRWQLELLRPTLEEAPR